MPPKLRAKIKDQVEQEGRVLLAISSLRKKEITNIREAARLYDVPRTTLQRRLNGSTNRAEKQANGLKLTKEEEESLVQWILSMDQCGAAPRPSHVQDMANCNGPKPCYLMYRYVQKNSLEKGRIDSMASDEFRACPRDQVTRGHLTSRWFCE